MMPCSEVHWRILPAISRELAVRLETAGMPRSKIALSLGTSMAAVSQYISGKRGGAAIDAAARKACGSLANRIAAGKVDDGMMNLEIARIVAIAKKSKLGKKDPCVVCASGKRQVS